MKNIQSNWFILSLPIEGMNLAGVRPKKKTGHSRCVCLFFIIFWLLHCFFTLFYKCIGGVTNFNCAIHCVGETNLNLCIRREKGLYFSECRNVLVFSEGNGVMQHVFFNNSNFVIWSDFLQPAVE